MAAYKTLKGQSIRQVAQDPTNPVIGEIWYNTTIGVLKGYIFTAAAWASSNGMNTGRSILGSAGTQTAGLAIGGYLYPNSPELTAVTETYDGSSWTSGGTMGTGRAELGGSGLQTAALAVGAGSPNAQVEEYDGSSWTSGGDLNTGRSTATATGPQTANLAFGPSADCEAYDGTSWTTLPGMTLGLTVALDG